MSPGCTSSPVRRTKAPEATDFVTDTRAPPPWVFDRGTDRVRDRRQRRARLHVHGLLGLQAVRRPRAGLDRTRRPAAPPDAPRPRSRRPPSGPRTRPPRPGRTPAGPATRRPPRRTAAHAPRRWPLGRRGDVTAVGQHGVELLAHRPHTGHAPTPPLPQARGREPGLVVHGRHRNACAPGRPGHLPYGVPVTGALDPPPAARDPIAAAKSVLRADMLAERRRRAAAQRSADARRERRPSPPGSRRFDDRRGVPPAADRAACRRHSGCPRRAGYQGDRARRDRPRTAGLGLLTHADPAGRRSASRSRPASDSARRRSGPRPPCWCRPSPSTARAIGSAAAAGTTTATLALLDVGATRRIAVIFDDELIDNVPADVFDERVTAAVTPTRGLVTLAP